MKPVIVLVGRPNVGKSTLFNRLTRARDALVADIPGLTRDRQYGEGRHDGKDFLVVDTGGIVSDPHEGRDRESSIEDHMRQQTAQAVDEGDAIIFIVDGLEGLTPADVELAGYLRRSGKAVLLVVNKAEGRGQELPAAEFHALGLGEPHPVSARRGDGISALMTEVLSPFEAASVPALPADLPHIAIAGRPNVGKSTLVNALLGEERVVVFDEPGTTRDSIRVPLERRGRHYVLIDTAGVRRRKKIHELAEKYSIVKTLEAVEIANVVILVVDAAEGLTDQDATLAGFVLEKGRALIVAVNKCDRLDREARTRLEREIERRLVFLSFVRVHFISALHGSGVGGLFRSIDRAFECANADLPTSKLNRVLGNAVEGSPPPMHHGRRIKPKFAHQGGKNPPLVVIHGNQLDALAPSYLRYLSSQIRRAFNLEGTPIRIECRGGDNPFEGRPDRRSPKRIPRKKRLARRGRR